MVKSLPTNAGDVATLKEGMATHSSILAWRIPHTEEPRGLQSMGSQESDTTYRLNHHHHYIYIYTPTYMCVCVYIYIYIKPLKNIFNLTFFFLKFWPSHTACKISAPWLRIESRTPALEAWSFNHWMAKEVLVFLFKCSNPQPRIRAH